MNVPTLTTVNNALTENYLVIVKDYPGRGTQAIFVDTIIHPDGEFESFIHYERGVF